MQRGGTSTSGQPAPPAPGRRPNSTPRADRPTDANLHRNPERRTPTPTAVHDMADAELSAYELERLENIKRNEARLDELGLNDHRPRRPAVRPASSGVKRQRETSRVASEPVPVRRSTRNRTAPDIYSDDTPLPDGRRAAPHAYYSSSQPYEGPDEPPPAEEEEEEGEEGGAPQPPAEVLRDAPEPGTSRAIKLDVDAMVEAHLGKHMSGPPTKDSVVKALTGGRGARFSKYSGSLEWKNCVLLWVNVGGSDYKNVFHAAPAGQQDKPGKPGKRAEESTEEAEEAEGAGMTMTWYASPRNNETTPVVARLIGSAASSSSGKGTPVLLFCRLPGEPYVCCGRLRYLSHVPGRQPVKFLWQLVDVARLRGAPAFEELMSAAPA